MAFTTKHMVENNQPKQDNIILMPTPDVQLNVQELVFLLNIIKQSTFLGEHVELTYNTIIKLQKQYLQQTQQNQ
jgi:hypothetical protein